LEVSGVEREWVWVVVVSVVEEIVADKLGLPTEAVEEDLVV
jgi:hypothetical protein